MGCIVVNDVSSVVCNREPGSLRVRHDEDELRVIDSLELKVAAGLLCGDSKASGTKNRRVRGGRTAIRKQTRQPFQLQHSSTNLSN